MSRRILTLALALLLVPAALHAQARPVIVVETARGAFAFEMFPNEAPKTVAHVLQLVRKGFYDGQRFHRALPGFVVQWGDPRSRDRALVARDLRLGLISEAAARDSYGYAGNDTAPSHDR